MGLCYRSNALAAFMHKHSVLEVTGCVGVVVESEVDGCGSMAKPAVIGFERRPVGYKYLMQQEQLFAHAHGS